jgi:hypothetical protein
MAEEIQLGLSLEKFASPLGEVIIEFNGLEVDAGRLIARLLRQDDLTAGVFAGSLSFLEKLKLIKALAPFKISDDETRNELIKLVREATEINALRNRFVHAEYMPLVGPDDHMIEMLHRRLKDSNRTVDPETGATIRDLLQPIDDGELRKLAEDIHNLAFRTRVLAEKLIDMCP